MNKKLQKIFLLFIISFFCFETKAQRDLITTNAGEEIRCKILDETPTRFIYAYLGPKNKVLRNEIFKNLVSSFKYSHFNDDILKNDKLNNNKKNSVDPRIDTRKSNSSKSSRSSKKEKEEKASKKTDSVKVKVPESVKIEDKAEPKKEVVKTVDVPVKTGVEIVKANAETAKALAEKATEELKDAESPKLKEKPVEKMAVPAVETKNNTVETKKEESIALESKKDDPKATETKKEESKALESKKEELKSVETKKDDQKVIETKKDVAKIENSKKEDLKKEQEAKEEAKKLEEVLTKAKEEAKSPFAELEPISEFKNYLKYRVGVKAGLGNIIQKNTDTSPYGLYNEKLLRGWMFGADAAYFLSDKIGLGVMYNNYQASNSSKMLDYPDFVSGEIVKNGSLSNKVSHKFIGPTLLYRKAIDFKTFAVLSLSPGMHLYTDKGEANLSSYKHTGKAYGASATLGLDFLLGNDIYGRDIILSLEGGYNYGQITSLNYSGSFGAKNLANPINLNRLDFSIGLRFTRFPVYLR